MAAGAVFRRITWSRAALKFQRQLKTKDKKGTEKTVRAEAVKSSRVHPSPSYSWQHRLSRRNCNDEDFLFTCVQFGVERYLLWNSRFQNDWWDTKLRKSWRWHRDSSVLTVQRREELGDPKLPLFSRAAEFWHSGMFLGICYPNPCLQEPLSRQRWVLVLVHSRNRWWKMSEPCLNSFVRLSMLGKLLHAEVWAESFVTGSFREDQMR